MILDTGLVNRHMLQQRPLLNLRQELCFHRRIRQDPNRRNTNNHSNKSQDDEHDLPSLKRSIRSNMLECKRHESTNDLAESETAVPDGETRCLLRLRVPLRGDEHEAGCDGCLKDTEEDAGGEEGGVVESGGGAGCGDAPEDDVGAEPFCDWYLLQEVAWRRLG